MLATTPHVPRDVTPSRDVTRWLRAWRDGDADALDKLMPLIYDELHRMAIRSFRGEKPGTLQPTSLVHEVFLRLMDQNQVSWQDRAHFFAIAAGMMRRVIIDQARRRRRFKRGGDVVKVPIEEALDAAEVSYSQHLALDEALRDLARFDQAKANLVELRFYGGLSLEEAAEVLGCSRPTVVRHWRVAKAWLYQELRGAER